MKKILFLSFTFLLLQTIVSAQKFAIAADKENVLYIGVDNPISIAVENVPARSIIIKMENGKISEQFGRYVARVTKVGPTNIILYKKVNGKLKEIGRSPFRVKRIPDPVFKIASGKTYIPKAEIENQQYVRAEICCDYEVNYHVDSFTVVIARKDTGTYEIKNTSNKLSDEIINAFHSLKENDILIFKNIFIQAPEEGSRQIAPSIVIIKN
jgi:hypothetical protein